MNGGTRHLSDLPDFVNPGRVTRVDQVFISGISRMASTALLQAAKGAIAAVLLGSSFMISAPVLARPCQIPSQLRLSEPVIVDPQLELLARETTVRIFAGSNTGSGVLIARSGQTYTVLTSRLAVLEADDRLATDLLVMTVEGQIHQGRVVATNSLGPADLVLVQFSSEVLYRVGEVVQTNGLDVGDRLYAAGFPRFINLTPRLQRDTRDLGPRAYQLTVGQFSCRLGQSLPGGYQIGYTNEIPIGMDGGPVFNQEGKIIAINGGRLRFPVAGLDQFVFEDGSTPTDDQFRQLEVLNWALPLPNLSPGLVSGEIQR